MAKRIVSTVIRKSDMVDGTMEAITRVISWSFNVLLSGETPSSDWEGGPLEGGGEQLAGGWRGAICQLRGDWVFYCELFKFPQWNSANRMCWLCQASSVDPALAWSHFGPGAGWRKTRWTHESYMRYLRLAGLAIPALFAVAIGFRLDCVMIDVLHTVAQGVASHIVANVLWFFAVKRKAFGAGNQESNVQKLYAHMQAWYVGKKTSKLQGKLSVERLRTQGGWLKLKAKAAATRHLARYALALALEFGAGDKEDRHILALCQLLCQFYDLIDTESMFFGPVAKAQIPGIAQRLVGIYTALATAAKEAGEKMWKPTPKMHLFLHLCEWQATTHGNPRYWWTYSDEDLQGSMSEVAASCHPSTMATSALFKWLHIVFAEQ